MRYHFFCRWFFASTSDSFLDHFSKQKHISFSYFISNGQTMIKTRAIERMKRDKWRPNTNNRPLKRLCLAYKSLWKSMWREKKKTRTISSKTKTSEKFWRSQCRHGKNSCGRCDANVRSGRIVYCRFIFTLFFFFRSPLCNETKTFFFLFIFWLLISQSTTILTRSLKLFALFISFSIRHKIKKLKKREREKLQLKSFVWLLFEAKLFFTAI